MNTDSIWNLFEKEQNKTKYHTDTICNQLNHKKMTDNMKREYCDKCKTEVRLDDGFLVCSNTKCGIIYKDVMDECAEWKFYNNENNTQDPTRCGMPINPLLQESSYGCKVLCKNNTSVEMLKIKRFTDWSSMPYTEKTRYDEFRRIQTMGNLAKIPKCIIDDALKYHKKISEKMTKDKTKYRTLKRDGIIAASIYISGRLNNYPRTPKEIATIFKLNKSSATKGCKKAITILNEMENTGETKQTILYQTKPISFIERYCSHLNMSSSLTKLCKFIAEKVESNNLIEDNNPNSVAVGIIYFISTYSNLNVSKLDVSKISKISEVTINKCSKKLDSMIDKFYPTVIYCEKLNISKELTQLCNAILIQVTKEEIFQDITKDYISSGIIHYVCKHCHLEISEKEINQVTEVHQNVILKCSDKIQSLGDKFNPCMIYCNNLELSSEITRLCQFIYMKIQKQPFSSFYNSLVSNSTNKHDVIAGIIHFVCICCSQSISIEEIHNISLIETLKIQYYSDKLMTMKTELFPSVIMKKYNI
jgi:transcription initiation factor TFIIB